MARLDRCDAELPNGKRCMNTPTQWLRMTVNLTGDEELWPVAVCDLCAERAKQSSTFSRMGPDRRRQYAEFQAEKAARSIVPEEG